MRVARRPASRRADPPLCQLRPEGGLIMATAAGTRLSTYVQPRAGKCTVWEIDPKHTLVEFGVKHMMFTTVKGRFTGVRGTINCADEADAARDNLNYATITSPIDGIVTRLNAEVGEVVVTGTMNNAGTVILEVADLSQMVLKAKVDESAIAQVKLEQRCKVRVEAYRDQVFDGVVKNVALANFDPAQSRGG